MLAWYLSNLNLEKKICIILLTLNSILHETKPYNRVDIFIYFQVKIVFFPFVFIINIYLIYNLIFNLVNINLLLIQKRKLLKPTKPFMCNIWYHFYLQLAYNAFKNAQSIDPTYVACWIGQVKIFHAYLLSI